MEERTLQIPAQYKTLGMGVKSLPPGPVYISKVKADECASNFGVLPNDEILALDGVGVQQLKDDQFNKKLGQRPLKMKFSRPPGVRNLKMVLEGSKLGVRFTQWPPAQVRIKEILPDSWGEWVGIKVGDELVAVDGSPVSSWKGTHEEFTKVLQKRPLQVTVNFGPGSAKPAPSNAASVSADAPKSTKSSLPPSQSPAGADPLIAELDAGSPRGVAHTAIITALNAHDAGQLAEALSMAKVVGIEGDGLSMAERALEAMSGPNSVGTAEGRRQAVKKMQVALASNNAQEIQEAVEEAVDTGVEDPAVLEAGEKALQEIREKRSAILDALVVALEDCVKQSERNPTSGCPPQALKHLSRNIEESRQVSGPKDDALIQMAERLLSFETQRAAILAELQQKVQKRAVAMERIVTEVRRRLPGEVEISGTSGAEAAEQVLAAPAGLLELPKKSPRSGTSTQQGSAFITTAPSNTQLTEGRASIGAGPSNQNRVVVNRRQPA